MAARKKRKLPSESEDATPHKLTRTYTKTRTSSRQESTTSTFRFMDLPAELRNHIYTYALVTTEKVYIPRRAKVFKYEAREDPILAKLVPWREPALLLASKEIRHEALGIYYEENTIKIRFDGGASDEAYNFIKAKTARRSDITMNYELQIHTGRWRDIMCWISLAKLYYETDMSTVRRRLADMESNFGYYCKAPRSLAEVASMGMRARFRGGSFQWVEQDFRIWVKMKMEYTSAFRIQHYNVDHTAKIEAEMKERFPEV